MKTKSSPKDLFKRYRRLIAVDAIFIITRLIINSFLDIIVSGLAGAAIGLFIIIFDFIFMVIHGIASYKKYRSVVFPNAILVVYSLVSLLVSYLIKGALMLSDDFITVLALWCCLLVPIAVIVSLITMLIMKLCEFGKSKNKATNPAK